MGPRAGSVAHCVTWLTLLSLGLSSLLSKTEEKRLYLSLAKTFVIHVRKSSSLINSEAHTEGNRLGKLEVDRIRVKVLSPEACKTVRLWHRLPGKVVDLNN